MDAQDGENDPRPARPGAVQAFIRKLNLKASHTALIPIILYIFSLVLWLAARPIVDHLASETYEAGVIARAAGEQTKAVRLFKKACGERNALACQAFRCLKPDEDLLKSDMVRPAYPAAAQASCAAWTR